MLWVLLHPLRGVEARLSADFEANDELAGVVAALLIRT